MSEDIVAHNINEKKRTTDVLISDNIDFAGLLLSDRVLQGLKSSGFEKPSPIQLKAIPLGRCGLDLIVQAKSGTGKTCVFSVIALEGLQTTSYALQVLVLAPTREIAIQIWEVVRGIGRTIPHLSCQTFIGGMPLQEDRQKIKKCHIAVGTPGRIKQLIELGMMTTDSIRMFVLDEADKLLEEGFQEQINWIYSSLPDNKQMLALSATYPEYLAQHLTAYMRNPTFLRLNISDPALLGINQYYRCVAYHPLPHVQFDKKTKVVTQILSSVNFQQCLIFSNLQTRAQNTADALTSHGWPTACIAGSLDQKDRNEAMSKLKTYKCRVLISTDLTSRGIDADKVDLVINLDIPKDHETYLHRIGRAGRFGTFGAAITIVSEGQEEIDLQYVEGQCNTHITPLPDPIPVDLPKSECRITIDDVVSTKQIVTSPEKRNAFMKKKRSKQKKERSKQNERALETICDENFVEKTPQGPNHDHKMLSKEGDKDTHDVDCVKDVGKDTPLDDLGLKAAGQESELVIPSVTGEINSENVRSDGERPPIDVGHSALEETKQNVNLWDCEKMLPNLMEGDMRDKDRGKDNADSCKYLPDSAGLQLQIPSFRNSISYKPVKFPHTYASAKSELEHYKSTLGHEDSVANSNSQFQVKVTSQPLSSVDEEAKKDLLQKISHVLQNQKNGKLVSTVTNGGGDIEKENKMASLSGKDHGLEVLGRRSERDDTVEQLNRVLSSTEKDLIASTKQNVQVAESNMGKETRQTSNSMAESSNNSVSSSVVPGKGHREQSQLNKSEDSGNKMFTDDFKSSVMRVTGELAKSGEVRADDTLEPSKAWLTEVANIMKRIMVHEKCSKAKLEEKILEFLKKSCKAGKSMKGGNEPEYESDISDSDTSSDSNSSGEESDDERTQVEEDIEYKHHRGFLREEGLRNPTEWDECMDHVDDEYVEYGGYDGSQMSGVPHQPTQRNPWVYSYPVVVPPLYYYPYPAYWCYPPYPGYPVPGYSQSGPQGQCQPQHLRTVFDNQREYIRQMLYKS